MKPNLAPTLVAAAPPAAWLARQAAELSNRSLAAQLPTIAGGLGALYLLFMVAHMLLLAPGIAQPMAGLAGATALSLIALGLVLRRRPCPPWAAHPIGAAITLAVLLNTLAHLGLSGDPAQTTNLILVALGAGFLLAAPGWLIAALGLMLAGWAAIALAAPSPLAWAHSGFALVSSALLAALVQRGRAQAQRERLAAIDAAGRYERKFHLLIEDLHEVIFQIDADDTWRFVSPAWAAITGLSPQATIGRPYLESIHPDDHARVRAAFRDLADGPAAIGRCELRCRTATGELRWVEALARRMYDEQGRPCGVCGTLRDITGRRQDAEQIALQANILAHVSDAVIAVDMDRRVVYWNQAAELLYGVARADAIGREPEELFYPAAPGPADVAEPRRAGIWRGEHTHRTRDGRDIAVSVSPSTLRDELGEPIGWLAVIHDISAQLRARDALQAHAQRQAAIVQISSSALGGLSRADLLRELVWQVAAAIGLGHVAVFEHLPGDDALLLREGVGWGADLLGRARVSAAPGGRVGAALHADASGAAGRAAEPLLEQHGISACLHVVIRGPGRPFGVLGAYADRPHAFSTSDQHFLQSVADVLGAAIIREQAEQSLRSSVATNRALLNAMPDLLFRISRAGRFVNLRAPEGTALGHRPEALLDQHLLAVMPAELADQALAAAQRALAGAGLQFFECRLPVQGALRDFEFRIVVSEAEEVIAIVRDMTQRTRAEEALRQARTDLELRVVERTAALDAERASLAQRVAERTADLQAANAALERAVRLKDEFLANMSHELRTPLTAILGLAEALQHPAYGALTDRQRTYLTTIAESGQHLLALINDILDLAKIEADRMELDWQPVDLGEIAEASLRMVSQVARQKQITVKLQVAGALTRIDADERRLKQILVNLLSNAVKFTPEGGAVGLEIAPAPDGDGTAFSVWDTGIGIAEANLATLFRPFVQLDSRLARQYDGTGLGLALVTSLARLHGGTVEVRSALGEGSRFTVSLPRRHPAAPIELAALAQPAVLAPQQRRGVQVLMVDDNAISRTIVADFLEHRGYQITPLESGLAALDAVRGRRPDLILMDIQMPDMDGFSCITALRALPGLREVPIIALTALAMSGDRERCLRAGASDYLSKPFRLADLAAMIACHL